MVPAGPQGWLGHQPLRWGSQGLVYQGRHRLPVRAAPQGSQMSWIGSAWGPRNNCRGRERKEETRQETSYKAEAESQPQPGIHPRALLLLLVGSRSTNLLAGLGRKGRGYWLTRAPRHSA